MKNTRRALRRHHRQRMIRRATRSYVLGIWDDDLEWKWHCVLRRYDNMAICSCYRCGNARKHYHRPPAQERRLNEAARYELRALETA